MLFVKKDHHTSFFSVVQSQVLSELFVNKLCNNCYKMRYVMAMAVTS